MPKYRRSMFRFGLSASAIPLAFVAVVIAGEATTQRLSTQPSPSTLPSGQDPLDAASDPVKQSRDNMRSIGQAVMLYVNANKGRLPTDLSQLAEYLGKTTLANPRTGADVGYEYVKPAEKLAKVRSPQNVPMAYELDKDGKRLEDGLVLYVDGHVAAP